VNLSKTDLGHRVLQDRSVALSQPQRAALILLDGRHTVAEVLAATASIGVTNDDIELLVSSGLVHRPATKPGSVARASGPQRGPAGSPGAAEPSRTSQQRYQDAYPIAARLTASLGLRGFLLNLAVEGALNFEQLRALSPRIREAVGSKAFAELDRALNG
jgi:hypothetical protein